MLSFLAQQSNSASTSSTTTTGNGSFFDDDIFGQRGFITPGGGSLGSNAHQHHFPFSGFPVHPSPHDSLSFTGGFTSAAYNDSKRLLQSTPSSLTSSLSRDVPDKNIKVSLENKELWQKFNSIGTEMIITKSGRFAITVILFL
ncbi:hypothetical protein HELRODRAFT_183031 [Helobdella robusta]|uniref:T-box domain-containing protein n=1 Tax=Helobdella robusta TaxID=6412 RepID=T1FJ33_HELRO|nr:hypothetical protein HELRODRAFT_183031 [Helobdella robusta]ESN89913.1 hypothetical protein HELRODRAFT_183031 [Helobdella robusta]